MVEGKGKKNINEEYKRKGKQPFVHLVLYGGGVVVRLSDGINI